MCLWLFKSCVGFFLLTINFALEIWNILHVFSTKTYGLYSLYSLDVDRIGLGMEAIGGSKWGGGSAI